MKNRTHIIFAGVTAFAIFASPADGQALGHSLRVTRGAWLLDIRMAGGDCNGSSLLLVQRGDTVVVEATLENLKLRGQPFPGARFARVRGTTNP